MKHILKYNYPLAFILSVSGFGLHAQQVTNPATNLPEPPQTVQPGTVTYPGLLNFSAPDAYNYIRTQVPDQPVTEIPAGNALHYRQNTSYFDGLGRPLQSVTKNGHAEGYDLVQHHAYDATGKEPYQYLPIAVPLVYSDGKLRINMNTLTHDFYNTNNDDPPYSKTEFDNSPLNRVTKQLAPGKSWVGSNRGVQFEYRGNLTAEGVRLFTIGSSSTDLPVSNAAYGANELSVTKTTDEDGKYTLEYKDRQGRLILKKSYLSGSSQAHDGFACTYYVYDGMQRLRYVIPPEAVAQRTEAGNTWSFSTAVASGLCYKYFYNSRGQVVEKMIPGKAAELFVYDLKDRLAFYQDGNLAPNKWTFYIYDALDRQVCFGTYQSYTGESQQTLQNYFTNGVTYQAPYLIHYQKNYALYNTYPATISGATILGYNYYDDYEQLPNHNFDANQFLNITPLPDGTTVTSTLSTLTNGLPTGSKIKVMDPDNPTAVTWLTSANYYDARGRLIQSQSYNLKNGLDISSNVYYFQGMLWKNVISHHNPAALIVPGVTDFALNDIVVTKTFERNLAVAGGSDQVYRVSQKIGNGINYDLAYYNYDHMGRSTVKQFTAANVLQEYNTRGFLNHIQVVNPNNNATNNTEPHIFEETLCYDKGFESKLYNGNIAGIKWKKAGTQAPWEAYGYSYDNLNRLTHAEYGRYNQTVWAWQKNAYDYTASNISYDLNGNILSMDQRGINPPSINTPINMDQLLYTYAPNSNKLVKVKDNIAVNATTGLPDFKDNANDAEEYHYDQNGNLVTDENKSITAITYNYLNKPEKITVAGQGIITYVYDASGNRLQKRVYNQNAGVTDTFDYIGNFVYKQHVLQYILNEEGRCRPIPVAMAPGTTDFTTKFVYDYFVKDHLGNVRSTVTATPIDGIYLARHEVASANIEQLIFDNIPNVRDNKPGSTAINDAMAARLDGSDPQRRIGSAIMLQTMPGDRFNISVDAFYEGQSNQEEAVNVEDVVSSLMGALTGGSTYEGIPVAELPDNVRTIATALNNPLLPGQLDNLVNSNHNPNAPKAHLNYLFFNDKLELQPGNSGVVQVPVNPMGWVAVTPAFSGGANAINGQVTAEGAGWVIIYIDNQTLGKEVWFDNLMVGLYKGEVTEEDHYYPFGLTLQTSVDNNVTKNPYKLTTKELESSFGINAYDFGARMQDMQLGRWWSIDPMAEKYNGLTPYNYCVNNPVRYFDPNGKEIWINYRKDKKDQRVRYDNGRLYNEDGSAYSGKIGGFLNQSVNALNKINTSKTGNKMLVSLSASKNVFDIKHVSENPSKKGNEFIATDNLKAHGELIKSNPAATKSYNERGKDISGGSGGPIYWNPNGGLLLTTDGLKFSSETDLAHELAHGYDADRGLLNSTTIGGVTLSEYQASYMENLVRGELQKPLRKYYKATVDSEGNLIKGHGPLLNEQLQAVQPEGYKP